MVAMSIVVAAFVPQIRMSMAIAFALGIGLAVVMIVLRGRKGPLPSNPPGAHMMLLIDSPDQKRSNSSNGSSQNCEDVPSPVPTR